MNTFTDLFSNTKPFKVVSVSSNPNNFGLYGHILVAKDGEAWEVGRSKHGGSHVWQKGQVVDVPLDQRGNPKWAELSVEIPKNLGKAPQKVVDEVWQ